MLQIKGAFMYTAYVLIDPIRDIVLYIVEPASNKTTDTDPLLILVTESHCSCKITASRGPNSILTLNLNPLEMHLYFRLNSFHMV